MPFDTSKLPDQDLSLSEMTTFLAWREPLTADEIAVFGTPSERASQGAWEAKLESCRRQAHPELSCLVEELGELSAMSLMPNLDHFHVACRAAIMASMSARGELNQDYVEPTIEQLEVYWQTWPPEFRALCSLALTRHERRNTEMAQLNQWRLTWWRAASGDKISPVMGWAWRGGARDKDASRILDFADLRPHWEADSLEPIRSEGRSGLSHTVPLYSHVYCTRDAFLNWLRKLSAEQLRNRSGEDRARQYLLEIMASQEPGTTTKENLKAHCINALGITGEGFKRVWKLAVAMYPDWSKPGRRKSQVAKLIGRSL
jgi:hypothetical protein